MAVIKYKNPKYTEGGSEPKYIVIPTLTMENDEVYVGTTEPTEGEKIWVNPSNGLIKYKNGESWEDLVPKVDLSNYLAKSGLMSPSYKKTLDTITGVNTVTTLASLPITKRSIVATVTAATSLSLASNLELGQELYIRIYNNSSSAITQPIPNSGNFVSMNGTSVSIPSKSFIEMSIWCYESGKYSIRIGEIA